MSRSPFVDVVASPFSFEGPGNLRVAAMMDALWEKKLAMSSIAAARVAVRVEAMASAGGGDQVVLHTLAAKNAVKVSLRGGPLDDIPSVELNCSLLPEHMQDLAHQSAEWRKWSQALPTLAPRRQGERAVITYHTFALSRSQLEINRKALPLNKESAFPLHSEEELIAALAFLPLTYRPRVMCVSRGWYMASTKTEFADWHDSWRTPARDGEMGLSTQRQARLRLTPAWAGDRVTGISLRFQLAEPPPRQEAYHLLFARGLLRVVVRDAAAADDDWTPGGAAAGANAGASAAPKSPARGPHIPVWDRPGLKENQLMADERMTPLLPVPRSPAGAPSGSFPRRRPQQDERAGAGAGAAAGAGPRSGGARSPGSPSGRRKPLISRLFGSCSSSKLASPR